MSIPPSRQTALLALFVSIGFSVVHARAQESAETAPKSYFETVPGSDIRFEMLPIPGGTFTMGSPKTEKGRKEDEGPQIRVRVDPFYMGRYIVTGPEYKAFESEYIRVIRQPRPKPIPKDRLADAVTYPTPRYDPFFGPLLERMGGDGFAMPAVSMSHYAARQYTKWLSYKTGRFYRLPTEAEWEYACRAGAPTAFSFGDDPKQLDDYAWFEDDSDEKDGDPGYHKTGLKQANRWGLYDMHGNVAQWCFDAYSADWYKQFAGKTVSWHDAINWPLHRYPCVIRGGGYDSEAVDCRCAARLHSDRSFNANDPAFPKSQFIEAGYLWIGFRLVSPVAIPSEAEKHRYWDEVDDEIKKDTHQDRDVHEVLTPAPRPNSR
jgi:formylglycine-generating enzyme required for sulfatase activity